MTARLRQNRMLLVAACVGLFLAVFSVGIWYGRQPRFTEARFNNIRQGMSRDAVQGLLGPPHRTAREGDVWLYRQEPTYIIRFRDDSVHQTEIDEY